MAPHWKCGSGQPIAGSNPALSATAPCGPAAGLLRLDVSPVGRRGRPARSLATFAFRRSTQTPCRSRPASSWRTRSGIAGACSSSTPASGSAMTSSMSATTAIKARGRRRAAHEAGIAMADVTPSPTATSTPTTPARTPLSRHPDLRPAGRVGDRPHDRAHDPRLDRLRWSPLPADRGRPRASSDDIRVLATPGHTPAISRSPFDRTRPRRSRRPGLLHAGRVGRRPDAREGRSRRPGSVDAYDRSIERLQRPRSGGRRFGHDRAGLDAADPDTPADRRARYPSRGRARRGTSGALYLQSAIAGLNPLPRSPFSNAARRVTLRTGSRAAANREPCQVRKEAALSDHRRVPRNGLVRAARHGGHEQRPGRRRVHGNY